MFSKTLGFGALLLIYDEYLATVVTCGKNTNTVALGSVDGKAYFVNDFHRLHQIPAYCEQLGMGMATITSENQASFLKSVYDPTYFNGWYWLSAREWDHDGNFRWIESLKKVETFTKLGWSASGGIEAQCLIYSSNNHVSAYYFKNVCHREHYTLCETKLVAEIPQHFKQITRESQEFIKLGNFEGRVYYGDANLRSWSESSQFCNKKGLNLASLTTRARAGFLKSSCKLINFDGWFWVAGGGLESENIQGQKCSCYDPHDDISFKRSCESRHFTLCEGRLDINQSTTTHQISTYATTQNFINVNKKRPTESISQIFEEPILADAIDESANPQNGLNIRNTPESTTELYSKIYFIAGLFIVIIPATIGMLLRRRRVKPTLVYQTYPSEHPILQYFPKNSTLGTGFRLSFGGIRESVNFAGNDSAFNNLSASPPELPYWQGNDREVTNNFVVLTNGARAISEPRTNLRLRLSEEFQNEDGDCQEFFLDLYFNTGQCLQRRSVL